MVVVSASWVKNVVTYPPSIINTDIVIPNEPEMTAKAILICRPNSHHFQERTVNLDQPVKVGRSVARAKPSPTNAIFDCKVLSRNHALLWYENGKFYLQDTKSSNGTFVNNNRLSAETENHELSSGDIVQFGVDVVENNRKVTHGCIIATIKLYLPDGKEAKASPTIMDGDHHGIIPLDDLYKLNQIIQEANHREQCLETKLTALQNVVDDTRKSAEDSWQAYVGEERLLSRVSALENQLQQANKNWNEDRLREELSKLQEDNETYQIAAKEALEKLHCERLQAVALAMEQERARIAAEQEALLAREQFSQAQLELQEIAQKLNEEQRKTDDQRIKLEQREQELESRLESESIKVLDLQLKLHELNMLAVQDIESLGSFDESSRKSKFIYKDDLKCKEEILAENETCDTNLNKPNGIDDHIRLTVHPVMKENKLKNETEETVGVIIEENNLDSNTTNKSNALEETKKVTFKIPEVFYLENPVKSLNEYGETEITKEDEKGECNTDHVDSKTLKYQFQSAQNELKKKIEFLESISKSNILKITDLEKLLNEEKEISQERMKENECLKQELFLLQQKWKESCNENQQYKDKINYFKAELESTQGKLKEALENIREKQLLDIPYKPSISNNLVTYDQLIGLEDELVLLKEKFAQINEEKLKLQRDFLSVTDKYNTVCNRSYNKYFFYVAPLIFMVLYLLVSAMIS